MGHLISEDGICPQPDKLDSIKNMLALKCTKEIKQFLGLTGYYRKFVPRFALTRLTKKETVFNWTPECQKSFDLLKSYLCDEPILKYADTNKPYTLYTDASKYGWAGVLTQSHTTVIDGKSVTTDHSVTFVSGLFRGSQINWAALTKEAFAIYMSVKKLSFYLDQAEILLRSDHLPLKKFLQKNTLNFFLSIVTGRHVCIHLHGGKMCSTLQIVPTNYDELLNHCDLHLVYMGFGTFLRLIRCPSIEANITVTL